MINFSNLDAKLAEANDEIERTMKVRDNAVEALLNAHCEWLDAVEEQGHLNDRKERNHQQELSLKKSVAPCRELYDDA